MAAVSAVAMSLPIAKASQKKTIGNDGFINPMRLPPIAARQCMVPNARLEVSASMKEKAVAGLTGLALAAAVVVPDVAEAAQLGISPSLKNFLLSILSGGVVLVVLVGAVIGVANFDPVKRS